MPNNAADPWDAIRADAGLLAWYVASGADECHLDSPVDRLAKAAEPAAARAAHARPTADAPPPPPAAAIATPPAAALPSSDEVARSAERLAAEARTLAELEQAIRAFEGCALKKTAMNTVFSDGNPEAPLMLVGEAPGADEDRQGKPFVGVSGQLLDRMLAAIGRDRSNTYISNILPWRPPGNRKPTPQESLICMPFIRRHIALARPRLLVCLGGTSAGALLDTTVGIVRLRGRWTEYRDPAEGLAIPVMPTFHPAYLLRQPHLKRDSWHDFLEIAARLETMEQDRNEVAG